MIDALLSTIAIAVAFVAGYLVAKNNCVSGEQIQRVVEENHRLHMLLADAESKLLEKEEECNDQI
jgi:hypothetical protein